MTPQIRRQRVLRSIDSPARARPSSRALRATGRFRDSAQRVFDAWLDPDVAGQWLFATALRPMTHVAIDARVGGTFCFADRRNGERIEFTGEYIEIVPHRRLVFNLVAANDPRVVTRVTVEIAARTKGCEVAVEQEEVPPDDANYSKERWIGILYGLAVALDSNGTAAIDRKNGSPRTRTRRNGDE